LIFFFFFIITGYIKYFNLKVIPKVIPSPRWGEEIKGAKRTKEYPMPELPEVETIVRGLKKKIVGKKILKVSLNLSKIINPPRTGGRTRPGVNAKTYSKSRRMSPPRGGIKRTTCIDRGLHLSPKKFIQTLEGLKIEGVSRRGKYIIIKLSDAKFLLFHLKLTGQLIFSKDTAPDMPYKHLRLKLSSKSRLDFCDLRQFGKVYLIKASELIDFKKIKALGPEANKISQKEFLKIIGNRKARIKHLLLNKEVLAGLGNIYVDETLHQAGIHPLTLASRVSQKKLIKLYQAMRKILALAISRGGSSVADYLDAEGKEGGYQTLHRVYQREGEPCLKCRAPISRIKMGTRSCYFCHKCQRPKER
jgi:formamidopyrimidine-DNA glycosylase